MSNPEGPPVSPESVEALTDALMPNSASLGSRAAGFRSWLAQLAADGSGPGSPVRRSRRPEGVEGPPNPADVAPDTVNLVQATHLDDIREAAEWATNTRFLSTERRAAMSLLTDVLAIGAAAPLPAFLSGEEADAILDSFPAASAPSITLWRPVNGRESAGLWSAILWNRLVGDPQELHAGPECVAAAVAVAEARDRTLGELLDAITVGCGVGNWHRDAVGAAMEEAGIHTPGALAPVATAAAVGRLEGIGARNLAQSIRRASALTPMHPYRHRPKGRAPNCFLAPLASCWEQRQPSASRIRSASCPLRRSRAGPDSRGGSFDPRAADQGNSRNSTQGVPRVAGGPVRSGDHRKTAAD